MHGTSSMQQYQWDPVDHEVWQQLGIHLPLRADIAVTTNLGKHVILALPMPGEPDLAHARYTSLADL